MVHRYPALSGPCTHDKHHSLAVEGSPCLVQTRIPMDSLYWQVHGPGDLQTRKLRGDMKTYTVSMWETQAQG